MPRTVDSAITADAANWGHHVCVCFEIDYQTATALRVTDSDVALTVDSDEYTPWALRVDKVTLGGEPTSEVVVTISNVEDTPEDRDNTEDADRGSCGVSVNLYEVWRSATGEPSYTKFSGIIVEATFTPDVATYRCAPASGLRSRPGCDVMWRNCRYRFKDARCGYAGSDTTCDRSWTDCDSKSNSARFGGFRHIPPAGTLIRLGATTGMVGAGNGYSAAVITNPPESSGPHHSVTGGSNGGQSGFSGGSAGTHSDVTA